MDTVESLEERAVGFRSFTERRDTTSAVARLVFTSFAGFPEFEFSIIKERTRSGLDAALASGRVGGRPRSISYEDITAVSDDGRCP